MIRKSMIKPVAMLLVFALFAQQAYGDELQSCIAGAGDWRAYQDGLTNEIYSSNLAEIQREFVRLSAYAQEYALYIGVGAIIVVIAFTAVCAGLHLQLNPLAAQCWFSLANLIEVGGTIVLAIIVALLALAALYRTGMIAAAEEYRDELLAYAESVYNDDVAFCNLQYGG